MKKKYRKAICNTINVSYALILSPLIAIATIGLLAADGVGYRLRPAVWLKTKMRTYDDDPE